MQNWEEFFYYDETSPSCLRWKVSKGRRAKSGDSAGSRKIRKKYGTTKYQVMLDRRTYLVHRIIWELGGNEIETDGEIDHIDGNPENNRINNLRLVTSSVNSKNKRKYRTNSSGICGVSLMKSKGKLYWKASWSTSQGVKTKSFSVDKHGDLAKVLAEDVRRNQLEKLEDYTERHGK